MKQQSYHKSKMFLAVFGLLLVMLLGVGVATAAPSAPQGASSLGDLVWHDLNGDGFHDLGEPGIPNVVVRVWNDDGDNVFDPNTSGGGDTLFATTTTAFTSPTRNYLVQITFGGPVYHVEIPSNMFDPGQPLHGYVLTSASTIYPNPAVVIEPASIAERFDFDFGFARPGIELVKTAGNAPDGTPLLLSTPASVLFTYKFTNTGETILSDIEITDDNGTPGDTSDDFVVCAKAGPYLPNATDTCTAQLFISGTHTNIATVKGTPVDTFGDPISPTDVFDTDDAVIRLDGSLGDRVWLDTNGDGIQNFGEVGLAGVTVNLLNGSGGFIATDVTDSNGIYGFDNLPAGNYIVEFVLPSGHVFTAKGAGSDPALDSNANPANGRSDVIALAAGGVNLTIDAGLYIPASIGDKVWIDQNGNGIQDVEPGLPGVTVNLYKNGNPTPVATTTTDGSGNYLFDNLAPGSYTVEFVAPAGSTYVFTTQNAPGSTAANDSNPDPSTGKTGTIILASGDENMTIDAGLYQPASIGDRVWNDTNENGIQDGGELGLPNVTVQLFKDGNSTPVATTTTDGNGNYNFSNLAPGTYTVTFVAPGGYVFSPQNAGGNPATDSNANPSSGQTVSIVLTSGQSDMTIDAGLYQPAGPTPTPTQTPTNTPTPTSTPTPTNTPTPTSTPTPTNTPTTPATSTPTPTNTPTTPATSTPTPTNTPTTPATSTPTPTNTPTTPATSTPTPTSTPTTSSVNQPNISITKRLVPSGGAADGIVVQGDTVNFIITVVNTGNTTLVTVPLEDDFDPTYLGYVNSVPLADSVNSTTGLLRWNDITGSGVMQPGESKVVSVTFLAKLSTDSLPNKQTINVATVTGAQDDKGNTLPNKQDQAPVRITNPAIGIVKTTTSPANGVVNLNGEVVFTVRITNLGDTTLVKIPVQDIYEANIIQFVRTSISTPSVNVNGNNGTLNWADITTDLGDLAPGASVQFTVTFRLISLQETANVVSTGTSTDENGDNVDPVGGTAPATVRPGSGTYQLYVPVLSGAPVPTATPTPTLTPTPTPTPTATPSGPGGEGEPECPPNGCPVDSLVHPKGIAVHEGQQMVYMTSRDTNTLIKYNPATNSVVATVPTGSEPWDVVINEGTAEIYVSNFASSSVWVYDANTMAVKKQIQVGPNPAIMEIFPDINTVAVVVRGLQAVAIIQNNNVAQYVSSGGTGPYGLAADQVNKHLIVTNRDTGNAWVIVKDGGSWRLADGSEMKDFGNTERTQPFEVAYNPNNNRIYITYMMPNGTWFVDVIQKSSPTQLVTLATIRVGSSGSDRDSNVGGTGLDINPVTNNLFVADTADGTVTVIGPNNAVIATVAVGTDPYELAVNETTQTVYVTLRAANRLAKFADGF